MLSEQDFRLRADHALEDLQRALLPIADTEEFEVELQNGVLQVIFEEPSPAKFVVSPNAPMRQIWLSAMSRSYKLSWAPERSAFELDGESLNALVKRLAQAFLADNPFTLPGSLFSVRVHVRFEVSEFEFEVRGSKNCVPPPSSGAQKTPTSGTRKGLQADSQRHGWCQSLRVAGGVDRFTKLRAWQACELYKRAVYRLCEIPPLASDWKRRSQLEDSVRGPGAHIAEGFGRFSPPDFASLRRDGARIPNGIQNHLIDLVDRRYITEEQRSPLNTLAETALQEVTGLLEYLQSPEALRNARRARERRIATRDERLARTQKPEA
jgi:CyaY protein